MADWSPLRRLLTDVDGEMTVAWPDLDHLVGGLPRSAYDHAAFWTGDRTGWPGFTATNVRVGVSVTFVRRADLHAGSRQRSAMPTHLTEDAHSPADVVLVGCVKSKVDHPAPARDLYTSALFRKERVYAEASGIPWFILSAEHGLVAPTQVIEPYELSLASAPRHYRVAWGDRVVEDLASHIGGLEGKTVEVHAGAAYADAIRAGLATAGATMLEPLSGASRWGNDCPGTRRLWRSDLRCRRAPPLSRLACSRGAFATSRAR